MDETVTELAEYLVDRLLSLPPQRRLLVGIAGIPASGKSTLAAQVVTHANKLLARPQSPSSRAMDEQTYLKVLERQAAAVGASAILVGLDGWHLTRAQLDEMPDPVEARARRGAHWTFDGGAYAACVKALRKDVARPRSTVRASWHEDNEDTPGGSGTVIRVPTFDHAVKDPVPDAVAIYPRHRLVVIEGLYAFLNVDPWNEAGELLDERWLVQIEEDRARTRLIKRHVLTGVADNLEEATKRADENDMPNGRFLLEHSLPPTRSVPSIDDPVLAAAGVPQ